MNLFEWSIPFVRENVLDILLSIMAQCTPEEDMEADDSDDEEEVVVPGEDPAARRRRITGKIMAVSRMARMARILREEAEAIIQLKGFASGKIPRGLLSAGPAAIHDALSSFERAQRHDSINEMHPAIRKEHDKKAQADLVRASIAKIEMGDVDDFSTDSVVQEIRAARQASMDDNMSDASSPGRLRAPTPLKRRQTEDRILEMDGAGSLVKERVKPRSKEGEK